MDWFNTRDNISRNKFVVRLNQWLGIDNFAYFHETKSFEPRTVKYQYQKTVYTQCRAAAKSHPVDSPADQDGGPGGLGEDEEEDGCDGDSATGGEDD